MVVADGADAASSLPSVAVAAQLARTVLEQLPGDFVLDERDREGLRFLDPALLGETGLRPSALEAHAVTYAIVRRISRESLQSAVKIDMVAMFLLRALRRLAGKRGVTVAVPALDHVDRPSLRVLNRLLWLSDRDDRFRVVGICLGDPLAEAPEPDDGGGLAPRLARSRRRLFERLRLEWQPRTISLRTAAPVLPRIGSGSADQGPDAVTAVAEALVEHNYDRAYLLAGSVLDGGDPGDSTADLLRLVGLCDANIGEVDSGVAALGAALQAARRPELRAHLHYLTGLLITKRRYDLDAADEEYRAGLEELETAWNADDAEFERAWLLNGRALVASLHARACPPEERQSRLHDVMRQEVAAFRLATRGSEPRHVYLRHNLLANTAFVLEMLARFDEAIDFWHRAFGQFLGKTANAGAFEPIYRYRVGVLEWKAGREETTASLREALQQAASRHDRFQAERIRYALAFVSLDLGETAEALEHFRAGLMQAWELRDPLACLQHARGLCAAARRERRPRLERTVRIWLRLTGHHALQEVEDDLAEPPSPPSPKLPAYIPGIDLEPTPEVNLNVYLAGPQPSAGGDSSPRAAAAGRVAT
ncbi:hypothetical protein LP52_09180 [Streptomonospora alba]|uniref:Tetratricopeptide repeat protein n=1 Tax=Streptomonospora alba TaxID=183763 RepID=A0A0C2FIW1_9ACTN|nr:hypothetical protein [Streptomonospora alba]KIH99134.1 hypothetical protein LP52_09180 [Streptomonospora alba]